jgi:hypothetical protein
MGDKEFAEGEYAYVNMSNEDGLRLSTLNTSYERSVGSDRRGLEPPYA